MSQIETIMGLAVSGEAVAPARLETMETELKSTDVDGQVDTNSPAPIGQESIGEGSHAMIDSVVSQKKSGIREVRSEGTPRSTQARYLVAEYLYDWGLRDPEVIAQESRRIVDQAALQVAESGDPTRDLFTVAIEITQAEVEASIARMASSHRPSARKRSATNNSIVPRIGRVLLEFPDAIRHRDRPPARLLQVLETSVKPIIPCPSHCDMRPQPRARLWKLLRKAYWVRVHRKILKFTRRSTGLW
jgi:hypothetical protein